MSSYRRTDFAAAEDSVFTLRPPDAEAVDVRLVEVGSATEVDEGAEGDGQAAERFSALFHGPAEPVLPQRIYRLESERMGELDLFLVPVGRHGDGGLLYEAVFG